MLSQCFYITNAKIVQLLKFTPRCTVSAIATYYARMRAIDKTKDGLLISKLPLLPESSPNPPLINSLRSLISSVSCLQIVRKIKNSCPSVQAPLFNCFLIFQTALSPFSTQTLSFLAAYSLDHRIHDLRLLLH